MFCFCFQSPSLKLQALEAELGHHEASLDSHSRENPPAQLQPAAAEEKIFPLSHNLMLHPPPPPPLSPPHAWDQRGTEQPQPSRTSWEAPALPKTSALEWVKSVGQSSELEEVALMSFMSPEPL